MTRRDFGINESRPAIGGPLTGSLMRDDTQRILEFRLSAHRAPFTQMMIDLAAVVSIVVLSCAISAGIIGAGFILLFVRV